MKKAFLAATSLAFLNAGRSAGESFANGRQARYATADDLEAEANGLSNYTGGSPAYYGMGDEFLEFSGPGTGSFADAIHKGKIYTIVIKNNTANTTLTAALCPGLIDDLVGLIDQGNFNDITNTAGLSASGSPKPIPYFNNFVRKFPTMVAGFKISTQNLLQMEQSIEIVKQSPFKDHESKIINVSIYASEANPNTTLLTVPEPFFMDCQTQVLYPVLGATTVGISLILGVSLNIAKALKAKTYTAQANMSKAASSFTGRLR